MMDTSLFLWLTDMFIILLTLALFHNVYGILDTTK